MYNADLSTREHDGHIVVALHGELDQVDAASVAAALTAAAARGPEIIVDLAALTFIDSSGVAALQGLNCQDFDDVGVARRVAVTGRAAGATAEL